jgi:hypothetical protein
MSVRDDAKSVVPKLHLSRPLEVVVLEGAPYAADLGRPGTQGGCDVPPARDGAPDLTDDGASVVDPQPEHGALL